MQGAPLNRNLTIATEDLRREVGGFGCINLTEPPPQNRENFYIAICGRVAVAFAHKPQTLGCQNRLHWASGTSTASTSNHTKARRSCRTTNIQNSSLPSSNSMMRRCLIWKTSLLGERTFSTTALSQKGRQRNRHFRYGGGDGRMTHLRTVPQQPERPGRSETMTGRTMSWGAPLARSLREPRAGGTLDEMTTRQPALGSL